MGKHLVLAGAGHAHMVALQNIRNILDKGHRVTVIGSSDNHYYSGMAPGMLGGRYSPEEIRFNSRLTVENQGGSFLSDTIVSINPDIRVLRLESGREVGYDILSCNLGSTGTTTFESGEHCPVFTVKPIENLLAAREHICKVGKDRSLKIAIIGGGATAAEISGNIVQLAKKMNLVEPEVTVYCRGYFMKRFSEKVRKGCLSFLNSLGVVIIQHVPVQNVDNGHILTSAGQNVRADVIFAAQGVKPSTVFASSGFTVGPDGGLVVNDFLQSLDYPEVFGGGDCVYFSKQPLDKVGVYAVRQNSVLLHNLIAGLENESLQSFDPGGGYLLIFNLGNGYGILQKRKLYVQGRVAFWAKDFIDRRFMRRFQ